MGFNFIYLSMPNLENILVVDAQFNLDVILFLTKQFFTTYINA